jgi:two-component system nitrogen regulation response regulator GlnG
MADRPDPLDAKTREPLEADLQGPRVLPRLTLLWHPDPARVGEIARLDETMPTSVSRKDSEFAPPSGGAARPLADPFLSRQPLIIEGSVFGNGSLRLLGSTKGTVLVDGAPLHDRLVLDRAAVARGVVITLSERVVLLLHLATERPRPPAFGLVGDSDKLDDVRRTIERVSGQHVQVLLRGETGTGKELVARALAEASPWAKPYLTVNMGAFPPTVAAAELFGSEKGAFTDAVKQSGIFERARGGTLFLDEIGLTPTDVQPMLLRALGEGEIQVMGGQGSRHVKVRVIAATDANLEGAIAAGDFTQALLQRLSQQILIPPLRERREDLGRLLVHFLSAELGAIGRADLLTERESPWLPAALVTRLGRYAFPGNVRELRNLVRHLVFTCADEPHARVDETWSQRLDTNRLPDAVPDPAKSGVKGSLDVDPLSDERIAEAVRASKHNYNAAARALGISRTTLYVRLRKMGQFRSVEELADDELLAAGANLEWDLERMAEQLMVSVKALKPRCAELRGARGGK